MVEVWLTMEMASLGQLYMQGREKHPRQFPVTTMRLLGHSEQAGSQTERGILAESGSALVASLRQASR